MYSETQFFFLRSQKAITPEAVATTLINSS